MAVKESAKSKAVAEDAPDHFEPVALFGHVQAIRKNAKGETVGQAPQFMSFEIYANQFGEVGKIIEDAWAASTEQALAIAGQQSEDEQLLKDLREAEARAAES